MITIRIEVAHNNNDNNTNNNGLKITKQVLINYGCFTSCVNILLLVNSY